MIGGGDMDKKQQRRIALAARRALTVQERSRYSLLICGRLAELLSGLAGRPLLSYLAEPDEPDISALTGFPTAYPVCRPGGLMNAYIPAPEDPLAPGYWGIPAPDPARGRLVPPEALAVVLAPCAAFDEKCRRLGRGGGYYDRYLAGCRNALVIAVAFEAQRLPELVTEPHDRPVDMVVTESAVYRP